MNDIASYETGVRLKDAGFPQPTPEPGQFWYSAFNGNDWLSVVAHEIGKPDVLFLCPLNMFDWRHYFGATGIMLGESQTPTFAPTAIDILRVLPSCSLNWENGMFDMGIVCLYKEFKNPAEAAAAAWLELNNKK